jgi:hypothetical protein
MYMMFPGGGMTELRVKSGHAVGFRRGNAKAFRYAFNDFFREIAVGFLRFLQGGNEISAITFQRFHPVQKKFTNILT